MGGTAQKTKNNSAFAAKKGSQKLTRIGNRSW
jgi:hypothetical protein